MAADPCDAPIEESLGYIAGNTIGSATLLMSNQDTAGNGRRIWTGTLEKLGSPRLPRQPENAIRTLPAMESEAKAGRP